MSDERTVPMSTMVGWADLAVKLQEENTRLRSALYEALCGGSNDPADYGVTLDRSLGLALFIEDET